MQAATREMFTGFAEELNEYQDRRERIIKCSRDITALSKRVIFLLHRANYAGNKKILEEAEAKQQEIMALFRRIGDELNEDRRWIYKNNYTSGLQEWIECITFLYFLHFPRDFAHISIIQQRLAGSNVHCSEQDYLLGLSDLTGEIMRHGIQSVGSAGLEESEEIVHTSEAWVRQTRNAMSPISPNVKGLGKKLSVMNQSLQKLERVAYTISLKKEEYRDFPDALKEAVRRMANEPFTSTNDDDE